MDTSFGSVTQILRGYTYEQVRLVVSLLVGSKVHNVEITLNSDDPYTIIRKISAEFSDHLHIDFHSCIYCSKQKKSICFHC